MRNPFFVMSFSSLLEKTYLCNMKIKAGWLLGAFFLLLRTNCSAAASFNEFSDLCVDSFPQQLKAARPNTRLDSLLDSRDRRALVRYDSLYIRKPSQRLMLKLRGNVSGAAFRAKRLNTDYDFNVGLRSNVNVTTAVSANYRGLGVALSINPLKLAGRNADFEFNMNAYGNRYGADVIYSSSQTYHGSIKLGGMVNYDVVAGQVRQRLLAVNAYYAFNYRRFSYPAAFTQSQLQLRSCGSWMIGFSFMGSYLHFDSDIYLGSQEAHARMVYFALGGGYGYNFVTPHNWLFHLSTLPEIVAATYGRLEMENENHHTPYRFPNLINVGRIAVVKNYDRCFFGFTGVVNHSLTGDRDQLLLHLTKWRARVFFGLRLL